MLAIEHRPARELAEPELGHLRQTRRLKQLLAKGGLPSL
jgi:hypothetical protein